MKTTRGDYSGRIDSSGGNDDLDALAEAIDRMVGDVRERMTECRAMENACRRSRGNTGVFKRIFPDGLPVRPPPGRALFFSLCELRIPSAV